jgi:phosphoenolpyruvate carboxykinase (ATP)
VVSAYITEKFSSQINEFGINPSKIFRNLTPEELVESAVNRKEGVVNSTGSLSVNTGKYTGRSPDDRFIVQDDITNNTIDWGKINHPFPSDKFEKILEKMKNFVNNKELFVFDGFVGADKETRLPIRVINDHAWQSLFARQLFIRPSKEELENHTPEFTVMCINEFEAIPEIDGTGSNVFILIDLTRKIVLIGGTLCWRNEKIYVWCYEFPITRTWNISNALFCKYWKKSRYYIILWVIWYWKNYFISRPKPKLDWR